MGLGLQTAAGGAGGYNAILKYDARAGRMFRVDREQDSSGQYASENVDVTNGFQAVMDLAGVQVGWAAFRAGMAPDFRLAPLGAAMPARPEGNDEKSGKPIYGQCFKVMLKLGKASGGDIRELASSARVVIGAIDALHTTFEAAPESKDGKLPVVSLKSTTPVVSGAGAQKSTNYAPVFEIVKWVDRPADLASSDAAAPAQVAPQTAAPKAAAQHVEPPRQLATADAAADDWD